MENCTVPQHAQTGFQSTPAMENKIRNRRTKSGDLRKVRKRQPGAYTLTTGCLYAYTVFGAQLIYTEEI